MRIDQLKEQLDIAIEALTDIADRAGPPENIAKYALDHIKDVKRSFKVVTSSGFGD